MCSLLVLYPFLLTTLLLMPYLLIDRFIYSAEYTNKLKFLLWMSTWGVSSILLIILKSFEIYIWHCCSRYLTPIQYKLLTGRFTNPWNFGRPTQTCEMWSYSMVWREERQVKKTIKTKVFVVLFRKTNLFTFVKIRTSSSWRIDELLWPFICNSISNTFTFHCNCLV